jgi:hypothetical protein
MEVGCLTDTFGLEEHSRFNSRLCTGSDATPVWVFTQGFIFFKKGNLKTPIKTRNSTSVSAEPYYDSRSTTHTAMQLRKDKN